jgi:dTDP-glucose 4,6-dehydratase
MIEGIYRLMVSNLSEPVNLGNPQEVTILEFAEIIQKVWGKRCEVCFEPLPVDDPKTRRPDISRARDLLNWEPIVTIEDGLKKTLDWFK